MAALSLDCVTFPGAQGGQTSDIVINSAGESERVSVPCIVLYCIVDWSMCTLLFYMQWIWFGSEDGSRGGRAVTRLASQVEDRNNYSEYCNYIHRIHHRPLDGDVKWWSRVSELYSGHVKEPGWLRLNSMSLCIRILYLLSFLCMHDKCVNIMTWIAYERS